MCGWITPLAKPANAPIEQTPSSTRVGGPAGAQHQRQRQHQQQQADCAHGGFYAWRGRSARHRSRAPCQVASSASNSIATWVMK